MQGDGDGPPNVQAVAESHSNYHHFSHRLRKGWIFGWKVVRSSLSLASVYPANELLAGQQDTSDHQWNTFRSNLPILAILVALWVLTSSLYKRLRSPSAPLSPAQRTTFILLFSLPLLTLLHGTSLPKMLVILTLNFLISRLAGFGGRWMRMAPLVGWAFNLAVLFGNELCEGYKWGSLNAELGFLVSPF